MTKIVVTGGRGMLGTDLALELRRAGFEPVPLDLPEFNLCDPEQLRRAVADADAVINCAAYTNVDKAESEPALAAAVNAAAPGELGRLAAAAGKYVLHISTDFVFDGSGDRPWRETDTPAPLSVYGATKLDGEHTLAASGCRHAVVRVQWTYGGNGNHFIKKLLERAKAGGDIKMVDDQVGAPTWTRDVSRALVKLLKGQTAGLYHYAAAGYASRLDVAAFVLRELGLERRLLPCQTADFPAPARRPLNSRFDCTALDTQLGPGFRRPWQEALREFIQ